MKFRSRTPIAWLTLALTLSIPGVFSSGLLKADANADWPQFRGPGSLGVTDAADFPDAWSTSKNVAWNIDVPGRGWSSPIVWGNRIFLTTVIPEGEMELPKKGLYFG